MAVQDPNVTIVHLDVLPGVLDNYLALARRVAPPAAKLSSIDDLR